MRKAKIILIDPVNNETEIASFHSTVEAFQCAALLQALVVSDKYIYCIDHYIKGKGNRRTLPDSFTHTIGNSLHLFTCLKAYFKPVN